MKNRIREQERLLEDISTLEAKIDTAESEKADTRHAERLLGRAIMSCKKDPAKAREYIRDGTDEIHGARERRNILKKHVKLAVAVAILIILPALLYFTVIPRTEFTLRVRYNEGLLNQINVAPELRNAGTLRAGVITLRISVVNSTDAQMGDAEYAVLAVEPFSAPRTLESLTFRGDQYDRYTIIIDLDFTSGGKSLSRHWSHNTAEPWMNQDFTDTVAAM